MMLRRQDSESVSSFRRSTNAMHSIIIILIKRSPRNEPAMLYFFIVVTIKVGECVLNESVYFVCSFLRPCNKHR